MKNIYFKKLDINIKSGELISIVGPNSCGKTTFIKNISGKCNRDYLYLDDKDIKDFELEYKKNNILCVFNDNKYSTFNPRNELKYYLELLKYNVYEITSRLDDFIIYFKLESIIDIDFNELSIEDRIYIKILSLLIINPSLFCIDDLLTYLSNDKKMRILNYIKDHNITLISILSDLEDCLLFDKVLVYNKENVLKYDYVKEVLLDEKLFKSLGLSLPFIYDLNNMLKSYELINEEHLNNKELVDLLWK
ncbi:MAG: ATP-binding cassette domain-containing protein [Bacilli bacterium]|nr:ATP-binding cassette domain-containing protein [Bacilli bacterium]